MKRLLLELLRTIVASGLPALIALVICVWVVERKRRRRRH